MSILKKSLINAIFISIISAIYSFLFIFTSEHIEFLRLLSKSKTLQSSFLNLWSDFIKSGNMKYIGYAMICLTVIILMIMIFKKIRRYDEYQISILTKTLVVVGVLSVMMLPVLMVMLLSDPNYAIETIFLFAAVQWFSALTADLIYVVRY